MTRASGASSNLVHCSAQWQARLAAWTRPACATLADAEDDYYRNRILAVPGRVGLSGGAPGHACQLRLAGMDVGAKADIGPTSSGQFGVNDVVLENCQGWCPAAFRVDAHDSECADCGWGRGLRGERYLAKPGAT